MHVLRVGLGLTGAAAVDRAAVPKAETAPFFDERAFGVCNRSAEDFRIQLQQNHLQEDGCELEVSQ